MVPAGAVSLEGAVTAPRVLASTDLGSLPKSTVQVQYGSSKGPEQHTETGVLLADVIPADALATTDKKNDLLSFGVLAVGADGYSALVSYGEVSPDFGNRGILVSLEEDGAPLATPRLVVPGDVKGGRYVSDLVRLVVVRTGE